MRVRVCVHVKNVGNHSHIKNEFDECIYHIFAYLAYNLFKYNGSSGWRKNETEIKIKCIPRIEFVIDAYRIAQNLFTEQ